MEVWIVSKVLMMWPGTGAISAWKTSFDIAKLLKATILPSRVRFRNRQSFSTVGNNFEEVRFFFYRAAVLEVTT